MGGDVDAEAAEALAEAAGAVEPCAGAAAAVVEAASPEEAFTLLADRDLPAVVPAAIHLRSASQAPALGHQVDDRILRRHRTPAIDHRWVRTRVRTLPTGREPQIGQGTSIGLPEQIAPGLQIDRESAIAQVRSCPAWEINGPVIGVRWRTGGRKIPRIDATICKIASPIATIACPTETTALRIGMTAPATETVSTIAATTGTRIGKTITGTTTTGATDIGTEMAGGTTCGTIIPRRQPSV